MKPPAKQSPAPVGSKTSSSRYPGAMKWQPPWNRMAPYSPRLITRVRGPMARIFGGRAAQVVFARKHARFAVVDQQEIPSLMVSSSSPRKSLIQ